jgi:large subunit ribosomal protein L31
MKKDLHPQYYPNAKIHCACGNQFSVGATVPEIKIEICSNCHPFYTGREKMADTKGRVERFKKRLEKTAKKTVKKKK